MTTTYKIQRETADGKPELPKEISSDIFELIENRQPLPAGTMLRGETLSSVALESANKVPNFQSSEIPFWILEWTDLMAELELPTPELAECAICGATLQAVRPGKYQHVGECRPVATPEKSALIATPKIDKWLNELREILVQRSEFKLADNVVSARVVLKMLDKKLAQAEAQRDALLAGLKLACDLLDRHEIEIPGQLLKIAGMEYLELNTTIASVEGKQ